ncbi:acyl carrier protein, partial [Klebsiella aerogenes]
SFFELGGDSLKLLQLQKAVRSRLHREVTIAELFRYPTIRDLCAYLNKGFTDSKNTNVVQPGGQQPIVVLPLAENMTLEDLQKFIFNESVIN